MSPKGAIAGVPTAVVDWAVDRVAPTRQRRLELVAWVGPIFVYYAITRLPDFQWLQLLAIAGGGVVVARLSLSPGFTAACLVAGFPIAEIVLPLLLRIGVPAPIVRGGALWKEAFVGALVVAAVRHRRRSPHKPDQLDLLAAAFVALVLVYWAFPTALTMGDMLIPAAARDNAARTIALPFIALVAARHAGIDERWRRHLPTAALVSGAILGFGAVVEIVWTAQWGRFLDNVLQVDRYQFLIHSDRYVRQFVTADLTGTGETVHRATSLYGSPLDTAFAFMLPLAVGAHLLAREWHLRTAAAAGLIAAGLALTQTRGALVGGALVCLGATRGWSGVTASRRVRFAVAAAFAALLLLPTVADSSLGRRVAAAFTGEDDGSTDGHIERAQVAFDRVVERPLGQGLGSSGGIAQRYRVRNFLYPENQYLRVGLDLGIPGAVLFIALIVATSRRAHRRASRGTIEAAAAGALVGLAVTGLVLDSFDVVRTVSLLVALGVVTSVGDDDLPTLDRPRTMALHA